MKRPNFFILGAPKSGTTALSEYLRQHPQVFFCEPKEPHYFNKDFMNRYTNSIEQYLQFFAGAGEKHKAIGEGSVFYLCSHVAVQEILTFQPDARFIVMLRDPVQMAHALHSQAIYSLGEDVLDFATAWDLQGRRKHGDAVPRACSDPKLLLYGTVCRTGAQVQRLKQQVDASRVHFIFFENFIGQTDIEYRRVLGFLGLEDDERATFPPVNPNQRFRSLWLHQSLQTGRLRWSAIKETLGIDFRLNVADRIKEMNTVQRKRGSLDAPFERRLREYFHSDIKLLEVETGQSLAHWLS